MFCFFFQISVIHILSYSIFSEEVSSTFTLPSGNEHNGNPSELQGNIIDQEHNDLFENSPNAIYSRTV